MRDEALQLLSQNYSPAQVASKLGVTESYISQFMAETEFASKVAQAKLQTLQSYTNRDQAYDEIEDLLLAKLRKSITTVYKHHDILKALYMVNKAERRGASSHEIVKAFNTDSAAVVALDLPAIVKTKYKVNSNNEVIEVESRPLITADSRVVLTEQLNKSLQKPRTQIPNPKLEVDL
jgi:predicted transcriptional regulator